MRKNTVFLILLTLAVSITSCKNKPTTKEGFIDVDGGKVFYTIQGLDKPGIPILLLHGGPGSGGERLRTGFARVAEDRPVIVYDQLGCGRSDRPTDTTLWVIGRFEKELDQVIEAVGYPKIHLLGQSWGGTLAAQYLIDYQPKKVVSAILSSPMLDTKMWADDAQAYIKLMPEKTQQDLKFEFSENEGEQQRYKAAVAAYYKEHVNRKPAATTKTATPNSNSNKDIYKFMWGTNEFSPTGNLIGYSCVDQLNKIKMPVLYLCGEYDEASPKSTSFFQSKTPNSSIKVIKNGSHGSYKEQPEQYFKALNDFLNLNGT